MNVVLIDNTCAPATAVLITFQEPPEYEFRPDARKQGLLGKNSRVPARNYYCSIFRSFVRSCVCVLLPLLGCLVGWFGMDSLHLSAFSLACLFVVDAPV